MKRTYKEKVDAKFITKQEQKQTKNENWVASQLALSFNAPS